MPLHIEDPEIDRLAQALAQRRGQTIEEVVGMAIREQWRRNQATIPRPPDWIERLRAIAHRCATLTDLDQRPADEILGYDEQGLPA